MDRIWAYKTSRYLYFTDNSQAPVSYLIDTLIQRLQTASSFLTWRAAALNCFTSKKKQSKTQKKKWACGLPRRNEAWRDMSRLVYMISYAMSIQESTSQNGRFAQQGGQRRGWRVLVK